MTIIIDIYEQNGPQNMRRNNHINWKVTLTFRDLTVTLTCTLCEVHTHAIPSAHLWEYVSRIFPRWNGPGGSEIQTALKAQFWPLTWPWPDTWPFKKNFKSALEPSRRDLSNAASPVSLRSLVWELAWGGVIRPPPPPRSMAFGWDPGQARVNYGCDKCVRYCALIFAAEIVPSLSTIQWDLKKPACESTEGSARPLKKKISCQTQKWNFWKRPLTDFDKNYIFGIGTSSAIEWNLSFLLSISWPSDEPCNRLEQLKQTSLLTKRRIVHHLIHNIIFNCIMHTDKQMNVSYQASLVNRHIRRFTGVCLM